MSSKIEKMKLGGWRRFGVTLKERARKGDVWVVERLPIWYIDPLAAPTVLHSRSLNPEFRNWFVDTGVQLLSRVQSGLGVAPASLTAAQIEIVDKFVRIPPPSNTRNENVCDVKYVVELFYDLIVEVCSPNGLENDTENIKGDYESVLLGLRYILHNQSQLVQKNAARLFEILLCFPFFRCAYAILSFLKNAVEYLRNHYSEEQTKTKTEALDWRSEYIKLNEDKDYTGMIQTAISENPILKLVYDFGQGDGEAARQRPRYENSAVGVLLLMANFVKHANDHRKNLGLKSWSPEERLAVLEHHFRGEINECVGFFWAGLIGTDWDQHPRP